MQLSGSRSETYSFSAIKLIFRIVGDSVKYSLAFDINACAIGPLRCASRPFSSSNVSKIPYVPGLS